jgi:hypothetical protein
VLDENVRRANLLLESVRRKRGREGGGRGVAFETEDI